jgi:hypothetical protein
MDNSLSLFAMASEWMVNGNIIEFIRVHRDVNRFELVGLISTANRFHRSDSPSTAQRCCEGVDIYAWPSNDTRGLEGGMTSNDYRRLAIYLTLRQGKHPDRSGRPCLPR